MAYRQTPTVEARLHDNRNRILEVARSLVSAGGWKEAHVANIALAAGMATGTVYRYFSSKAELFAEVLSAVSQREVNVLNEIANSDGAPTDRLHAAVATFVRRAMRNPRLAYALIAEPCDREIDEARLTYRAEISEVFRTLITSGQASKELRSDFQPDVAASVIVGGFMEGLIGPLSPLSLQQYEETELYQLEVAKLADQIAGLACASVACTPINILQTKWSKK